MDPCLPPDMSDLVVRGNDTLHLRGRGDWAQCLELVRPFLGLHNGTMSPGGVYQVGTDLIYYQYWIEGLLAVLTETGAPNEKNPDGQYQSPQVLRFLSN